MRGRRTRYPPFDARRSRGERSAPWPDHLRNCVVASRCPVPPFQGRYRYRPLSVVTNREPAGPRISERTGGRVEGAIAVQSPDPDRGPASRATVDDGDGAGATNSRSPETASNAPSSSAGDHTDAGRQVTAGAGILPGRVQAMVISSQRERGDTFGENLGEAATAKHGRSRLPTVAGSLEDDASFQDGRRPVHPRRREDHVGPPGMDQNPRAVPVQSRNDGTPIDPASPGVGAGMQAVAGPTEQNPRIGRRDDDPVQRRRRERTEAGGAVDRDMKRTRAGPRQDVHDLGSPGMGDGHRLDCARSICRPGLQQAGATRPGRGTGGADRGDVTTAQPFAGSGAGTGGMPGRHGGGGCFQQRPAAGRPVRGDRVMLSSSHLAA